MGFIRFGGIPKRVRSLVTAATFAVSAVATMTTALATGGCVAEDLELCRPVVRFTFRYTHNTARQDLLAQSVGAARVYVFDEWSGVLTRVVDATSDDLARGRRDTDAIPPGLYTMVAWGTGAEDMTRSYSARQMVDEATHDHIDPQIGVTTLDDMYMMLESAAAPSALEGDVVPVTPDFDDLFWAEAREVEIEQGVNRIVGFDFLCNTSILRIVVRGLEHFEGATGGLSDRLPLNLFATGENGRYRTDDTIDTHAPTVHYASQGARRLGEGTMSLVIPMQRLHIRRHAAEGDRVLLYIERLTGAIPGIPPIDLVGAITGSNDGQGYHPFRTQESIDRQHEFRIILAISPDPNRPGYYRLSMSINEWGVIELEPDVDRPEAW